MPATDVTIQQFHAWKTAVPLRTPFMFGDQEVRHMPLVHVAARVVNRQGAGAVGWAAEFESPWFDKSPERSWDEKESSLDACISRAAAAFVDAGQRPAGPMRIWHEAIRALEQTPHQDAPALAVQFGSALCERAVLDAFGQAAGRPAYQLLDGEAMGLDPGEIHPPLSGVALSTALSEAPVPALRVRHTVGLTDPLLAGELPADAVQDGMPHTLEDFIRRFGLTHFKIKIGRGPAGDLERLERIASLLNRLLPHRYHASLDGNEQYADLDQVAQLWEGLGDAERFGPFRDRLLYIEQPVPRDAFDAYPDVSPVSRQVPLIIDEADDGIYRFAQAVERGWSGTSIKTCKGIFKALLNAALCRHLQRENTGAVRYLLTAEDLTCPAALSLHHYLRLASVLGLTHVEANSFHYVPELDGYLPDTRVAQVLQQHPHLYRRTEHETAVQRIQEGHFTVTSLGGPGLGAGVSMGPVETFAAHPACRVLPL